MAALVVPMTLQVTCSGTVLSEPWTNVFGVRVSPLFDEFTITQAEAVADAFVSFYSSLVPICSNDWAQDTIIVTDLRTEFGASFVTDQGLVVGAVTTHNLPPNIAICCSHRTDLGGRSFRGRTYLAGWTETTCGDDGRIDPAVISALQQEWDDLRSQLELADGGPYNLAVISRTLSLSTSIRSTVVDPNFDHQDRRKRR